MADVVFRAVYLLSTGTSTLKFIEDNSKSNPLTDWRIGSTRISLLRLLCTTSIAVHNTLAVTDIEFPQIKDFRCGQLLDFNDFKGQTLSVLL